MIPALFELCFFIIRLLTWALVLNAVFSTLASFRVLDTRNRVVWTIGDFLYRVCEPMLRPIRSVLPNFGGIDISPMIAILLLQFVATPALSAVARGVIYGQWSVM